MKESILVLLAIFGTAFTVHAGEPVYGIAKDLGDALDKATVKVEAAAASYGSCVTTYPSAETCKEVQGGYWQCYGVRANHGGSCGKKLDLWGEVIKTAKEAAKTYAGANLKAQVLKKEQELQAAQK